MVQKAFVNEVHVSAMRPRILRPIIRSMLEYPQSPLNVRKEDEWFFQEIVDRDLKRIQLLIEEDDGSFRHVGESPISYSAQTITRLPRIKLLPGHIGWIRKVYGPRPVGQNLVIERLEEPLTYVLRNPNRV